MHAFHPVICHPVLKHTHTTSTYCPTVNVPPIPSLSLNTPHIHLIVTSVPDIRVLCQLPTVQQCRQRHVWILLNVVTANFTAIHCWCTHKTQVRIRHKHTELLCILFLLWTVSFQLLSCTRKEHTCFTIKSRKHVKYTVMPSSFIAALVPVQRKPGRGQLYTEPHIRLISCHVTSLLWQEMEEELNDFFWWRSLTEIETSR